MRYFIVSLVQLSLFTLGMLTAGTGRASLTAGPVKVVIIGSSTAAGKNLDEPEYGGAPGNKPWPELFQEQLIVTRPGSVVVNLAVPGTTTFEGMPTGTRCYPATDPQHNVTAALQQSPDLVIISYQSAAGGDPTSQIMTNLIAMCDAATRAGVSVWVSTPMPRPTTSPPEVLAGIIELRAALLSTFGGRALDFFIPLSTSSGFANPALFLLDDLHPNQAGHRALAGVVIATPLVSAPLPLPRAAILLCVLGLLCVGGALVRARVTRVEV